MDGDGGIRDSAPLGFERDEHSHQGSGASVEVSVRRNPDTRRSLPAADTRAERRVLFFDKWVVDAGQTYLRSWHRAWKERAAPCGESHTWRPRPLGIPVLSMKYLEQPVGRKGTRCFSLRESCSFGTRVVVFHDLLVQRKAH